MFGRMQVGERGARRCSPIRPCARPSDSFARDRGISPQPANHESSREHCGFGCAALASRAAASAVRREGVRPTPGRHRNPDAGIEIVSGEGSHRIVWQPVGLPVRRRAGGSERPGADREWVVSPWAAGRMGNPTRPPRLADVGARLRVLWVGHAAREARPCPAQRPVTTGRQPPRLAVAGVGLVCFEAGMRARDAARPLRAR